MDGISLKKNDATINKEFEGWTSDVRNIFCRKLILENVHMCLNESQKSFVPPEAFEHRSYEHYMLSKPIGLSDLSEPIELNKPIELSEESVPSDPNGITELT